MKQMSNKKDQKKKKKTKRKKEKEKKRCMGWIELYQGGFFGPNLL